jgi:hypothetical protein
MEITKSHPESLMPLQVRVSSNEVGMTSFLVIEHLGQTAQMHAEFLNLMMSDYARMFQRKVISQSRNSG